MDLPFDFYTADPNFRFLEFVVGVDNKILNLHLPITLLDQAVIEKYLDLDEIGSYINLHGRILKSEPINLSLVDVHQHYVDLPDFFSKSRHKDSKILGFFTYILEIDPHKIIKVSVFIKKSSQPPSMH